MADNEDDEIEKAVLVETPRGMGRELTPTRIQTEVEAPTAAPGTGSDWFGPRQPMRPIAPPEVAGRVRDYLPGINLTTQPRPEEAVSFQALRSLAENCDILRLVIERRKDQLSRMPWVIRAKHDGTRRPRTSDLSASMRGVIRDVEHLFKYPDYQIGFRPWLRSLLEDVFVIDAPTLFCRRNRVGGLHSLPVIDGTTIKRILNEWGRTPEPWVWDGLPFQWLGQEINIDNAYDRGFRLYDGLTYPPAYQQILKGLPAVDYTARDLIYRPMNPRPGHDYGLSAVEAVMVTTRTAIARSLHQLEYYREGNQPEAFYSLPESWSVDNVQRFQDWFDNLYAGNLGKRRQLRFMAGGKGSYVPIKEPPLSNPFDEWLARIICFAFSYPPQAFVHQVNRATAEQHEDQAEKEGLEPVKNWFADLANEIIETWFGTDEIEFAWVEEEEIDPAKQMQILTGYADSGALTLNEIRQRLGEEPSSEPAASVLAVRTQSGRVPISSTVTTMQTQEPPQ